MRTWTCTMRKASAILNPRKLFLEVVSELVHAAPSRVTIPPWLEPHWKPWKKVEESKKHGRMSLTECILFISFTSLKQFYWTRFTKPAFNMDLSSLQRCHSERVQRLSRSGSHSTIITTLWPCSGEKHPKHLAQHCNRGRQDDLLEKYEKSDLTPSKWT